MGNENCCIRKTSENLIKKESKNQVDELLIKENRLAIAFNYVVEGTCNGLKKQISAIKIISKEYSMDHSFCFFQPEFLAMQYRLIEMPSPGIVFKYNNMSEYFWEELEYFYDHDIIQKNSEFNIIVVIKIADYRYYFNVRRKYQGSLKEQIYMFHDIDKLNSEDAKNSIYQKQQYIGYICREGVMMTKEKFNQFLNLKGNLFILDSYQSELQLIAFNKLEDSDIKSISVSDYSLENHNNNKHSYIFESPHVNYLDTQFNENKNKNNNQIQNNNRNYTSSTKISRLSTTQNQI